MALRPLYYVQNGDNADVVGDPVTDFNRSRQFYMDWAVEYNNSIRQTQCWSTIVV